MATPAPVAPWRRLLATLAASLACRLLDLSCKLDPPPVPPGLVEKIARRIEARGRVPIWDVPGPVAWRDRDV